PALTRLALLALLLAPIVHAAEKRADPALPLNDKRPLWPADGRQLDARTPADLAPPAPGSALCVLFSGSGNMFHRVQRRPDSAPRANYPSMRSPSVRASTATPPPRPLSRASSMATSPRCCSSSAPSPTPRARRCALT